MSNTPSYADKGNIRMYYDGYRQYVSFIRPVPVKVSCKGHYSAVLLTCVPATENCHQCPECGAICKETY